MLIIEPDFKDLNSEKLCVEVSSFLQSGLIDLQTLDPVDLFNLLQLCEQKALFQKLKPRVGIQLEKRMADLTPEQLATLIQHSESKGHVSFTDWILFHFKQKKLSEEQAEKIDLPLKIWRRIAVINQDKHLEELFADVLDSKRSSILKSCDEIRFSELLGALWNNREVSGDYLVKSSKNNSESKFHKLVLNCLPFFRLQNEASSLLKKGSEEHNTFLSMKSFEILVEFFYHGRCDKPTQENIFELLDRKDGIYFYFASEDKTVKIVQSMERILCSQADVNLDNCINVLLFAINNRQSILKKRCIQIISSNPSLISQVKTCLENPSDVVIVLEFIATVQNRKLSKNKKRRLSTGLSDGNKKQKAEEEK